MATSQTAHLLGLTTSLLLSGINLGTSLLTMPTLYHLPPSTSTPIFRQLYVSGAATLVPLGIFSASCSAVAAYLHPSQRPLLGSAALATGLQTPWTLLLMMGTNDRLSAIAGSGVEQEKVERREVEGLLKKWTWMNGVRGMMALVGGLAGLGALVLDDATSGG
ncbi:MAG: hypothetical protein Q9195_000174 [Heterodermia aff. obscurata]